MLLMRLATPSAAPDMVCTFHSSATDYFTSLSLIRRRGCPSCSNCSLAPGITVQARKKGFLAPSSILTFRWGRAPFSSRLAPFREEEENMLTLQSGLWGGCAGFSVARQLSDLLGQSRRKTGWARDLF